MQNFYSTNLHNSDEDQSILQFRAAIPYQIGDINNIARITVPYATDTASGNSGFTSQPMVSETAQRLQDSVMQWPEPVTRLPDDAPNILIVLLDDVGFGISTTSWTLRPRSMSCWIFHCLRS